MTNGSLGSVNISQRQAVSSSAIVQHKSIKECRSLPVHKPFIFEKLDTYACISVTVMSACQQASAAACLFFRNATMSNEENTAKLKNDTLHHRFKQHNQQTKTKQASI
jgi:hypothetical protein